MTTKVRPARKSTAERWRDVMRDHDRKHAEGITHFCTENRCGRCGNPLQWAYDGQLLGLVLPNYPGSVSDGHKLMRSFRDHDALIEPCMNRGCDYRPYMGRHMRTSRMYYLPGGDGYTG